MMDLKEEVFRQCVQILEAKIHVVESELKKLDDSQKSEAKSSMGDKYETSREMMQRERDNLIVNLKSNRTMLETLKKINIRNSSEKIVTGSLIETNTGIYFLCVGMGIISLHNVNIFVVSLSSPIGQHLIGKSVNDSFIFNNKSLKILSIL